MWNDDRSAIEARSEGLFTAALDKLGYSAEELPVELYEMAHRCFRRGYANGLKDGAAQSVQLVYEEIGRCRDEIKAAQAEL